jgi:dipeptidyl-peptidase-4
MAIAVAPVTNWRMIVFTQSDTCRPAGKPKWYDENSPINHVDKLKGKFL